MLLSSCKVKTYKDTFLYVITKFNDGNLGLFLDLKQSLFTVINIFSKTNLSKKSDKY